MRPSGARRAAVRAWHESRQPSVSPGCTRRCSQRICVCCLAPQPPRCLAQPARKCEDRSRVQVKRYSARPRRSRLRHRERPTPAWCSRRSSSSASAVFESCRRPHFLLLQKGSTSRSAQDFHTTDRHRHPRPPHLESGHPGGNTPSAGMETKPKPSVPGHDQGKKRGAARCSRTGPGVGGRGSASLIEPQGKKWKLCQSRCED
jgi:hypothetical protein